MLRRARECPGEGGRSPQALISGNSGREPVLPGTEPRRLQDGPCPLPALGTWRGATEMPRGPREGTQMWICPGLAL